MPDLDAAIREYDREGGGIRIPCRVRKGGLDACIVVRPHRRPVPVAKLGGGVARSSNKPLRRRPLGIPTARRQAAGNSGRHQYRDGERNKAAAFGRRGIARRRRQPSLSGDDHKNFLVCQGRPPAPSTEMRDAGRGGSRCINCRRQAGGRVSRRAGSPGRRGAPSTWAPSACTACTATRQGRGSCPPRFARRSRTHRTRARA